MKHPTTIEAYPHDLQQLAQELGDLRYDALEEFLQQLSQKIAADGAKDAARGRTQLASALAQAAQTLEQSSKHIAKAWRISAPYLK